MGREAAHLRVQYEEGRYSFICLQFHTSWEQAQHQQEWAVDEGEGRRGSSRTAPNPERSSLARTAGNIFLLELMLPGRFHQKDEFFDQNHCYM